ncbi:MAG: hypothetical protein H6838_07930 [Planctomycetes bacterium]|nr:hypothetical protein [Planctomycetota bacterium]
MAKVNKTSATRDSSKKLLAELEQLASHFGDGSGDRKFELLRLLEHSRLRSADDVQRLHEVLCHLRAYPDHAALLDKVVECLDRFDSRDDLLAHREALRDTGIAGTTTRFAFFATTAIWLSRRLPGALEIVWDSFEKEELLAQRLALLATWPETPGLDEVEWSVQEWIRRLAGPSTTDADFVIERCARLGRTEQERETFLEELDFEFDLLPRIGAPSRSRALLHGRPVHYQVEPLQRARPDLKQAVKFRAREVELNDKNGARVIALARDAMVVRHRDLDAFAYGDPRDVRLFECGDGLEFAVVGMRPDRRLLVEGVYAYLTLKNGVPIGYVLTSGLFGSSEVAYNVFDTWRGGEAGHVYGRALAVTQQLYGSDTFAIYPYQLGGGGNDEGLQSGAWWFYQKLGFRARDPQVLKAMERELAKMRKKPGHRTSIATLQQLAEHNVYWSTGKTRDDVVGVFPIANLGVAVTDLLARRFGADRERGLEVCADEAAELCGARDWTRWSKDERRAWQRWSPLILCLPGVSDWSAGELQDLAEVARAKGGPRESDYVRRLDAHKKLRAALRKLAKRPLDTE